MNSALQRDFPDVFYRRRSHVALLDAFTHFPPYLAATSLEYTIQYRPVKAGHPTVEEVNDCEK